MRVLWSNYASIWVGIFGFAGSLIEGFQAGVHVYRAEG